jgi:hypothetical protein
MKNSLKRRARNILFHLRCVVGLEKLLVIQGDTRAHQIHLLPNLESLADAEFSVFSQWGEDGILSWLVDAIDPAEKTFVELGVEDYRESNTRYLLMTRSWSGLIIDGSAENIAAARNDDIAYKFDLETVCAFINRDNIAGLISNGGFDGRIGILSVDIDGVDYWVVERIPNPAAIVVVEYNQIFGAEPVSVPYDPSFVRLDKHWSGMYWGASLSAFRHLLEGRGYSFIGTNRAGTNAFFVDSSLEHRIDARLKHRVEWPSKMREARRQDGSLAFKRYDQMKDELTGLPVINVITGETVELFSAVATS